MAASISVMSRIVSLMAVTVVLQVAVGQVAAPPIFQPLLANLIAADMEIPDFRRDALEVLAAANCSAALQGGICRAEARRYRPLIDVHPALFEGLACAGFRLAGSDVLREAFVHHVRAFHGIARNGFFEF